MADDPASGGPVDLVRDLLRGPRESGTPEAARARNRILEWLVGEGYQVEVQRFSFSPSALLGLPVFGAGLGWLALLEIPLLVMPGIPSWAALAVWVTGLGALALVAAGLSLGWARVGDPREDANLVATRGPDVRRWIVAHYDTKSQGHSMAGRLVAVWLLAAALLALTALAALRLGGPVQTGLMAAGTGLAMAAGFLAGRGRLSGQSPGARDNGTGLLAALVAAREIRDAGTGIIVTGAEEFGLIGARYFAQAQGHRLAGTTVINLDTVDQRGDWRVVAHRREDQALAARVAERLRAVSPVPVRQHRLPAGIFVDSLPLARAGAAAVTVARLDWTTLRTIHTPRDTADGLALDSAVQAGRLLRDL